MNFRAKNFLISVLFPFLFVMFLRITSFDGFILYGTVLVGVLMQYFLVFWILNFEIYPNGFITVLLLPAVWFGSFLLIYQNFIVRLGFMYQVFVLSGFFVLQYYLLSTQNILNVSQFRSVSLSQAAYTTNNFYTILTFFAANLGLFLIPNISNPLKLVGSFFIFVIVMLIFVVLNNIDRFQYFFSVFSYFCVMIVLGFLYLIGFIDPHKILLLLIAISLIFRAMIILSLYSSKRVISNYDYLQIAFESGLLVILLNFVTK